MAKLSDPARTMDFGAAEREFGRWRRKHQRGRIPESLWATAVELAREHGVSKTSRKLRLDYYGLKRRLDSNEEEALPRVDADQRRKHFIEAPINAPNPKRSCTLELRSDRGDALRMDLAGMTAEEILVVVRGLRGEIQ